MPKGQHTEKKKGNETGMPPKGRYRHVCSAITGFAVRRVEDERKGQN